MKKSLSIFAKILLVVSLVILLFFIGFYLGYLSDKNSQKITNTTAVIEKKINLSDSLNNVIIGEWSDNVGSMIFDKDGSFTIIFQNIIAGGDNFKPKGKETWMSYKFDFNKNPYHLDIMKTEKSKNKITIDTAMKCIANIEYGRLIIRMNNNKKRPEYFDGNVKYTLILNKK